MIRLRFYKRRIVYSFDGANWGAIIATRNNARTRYA